MLNLLLLYILHDKIEDITRVEVIMSRLIQIQHVDHTTYDTYNFDDPLSILSYFKSSIKVLQRDLKRRLTKCSMI